MSGAQEALDYLVRMARGHDYADDARIVEAQWAIEDALEARVIPPAKGDA